MNTRNEIANSLITAFGSSANKKVGAELLQAEIIAVKDAEACKYTISYQGNKMEAFAANGSQYKPKDQVYVLASTNNFSTEKVIISGIPNPDKKTANENASRYITVADDIFDCQNLSWPLHSKRVETINVEALTGNAVTLLQEYLQETSTFALKIDVQTNLINEQQKMGNYGIKISFPFVRTNTDGTTENIEKVFTLDVPHMLGSPYHYITKTTQQLNFTLTQTENEKYKKDGIPSISLFTKDFPIIEEPAEEDIFISNLRLSVTRMLTEEEAQKTAMVLYAEPDTVFLRKDVGGEKTIRPLLILGGYEVELEGYNCYWAYKDDTVTQKSDSYCKAFGAGWHCLNEKLYSQHPKEEVKDDTGIFEYVLDKYEIKVMEEDIAAKELQYKCILKNSKEEYYATIVIKNKNSTVQTRIEVDGDPENLSSTGPITLTFIAEYPTTEELDADKFSTIWTRYDKNDNEMEDPFSIENIIVNKEDKSLSQKVTIYASSIDTFNNVRCMLKYKEKIWGTASIQLNIGNAADYYTILNNGSRLFYYDEDGDSPFTEQYDKVVDEPITIIPLSFTVKKKDGTELNSDEMTGVTITWRIPKNSLFVIDKNLINETITENNEEYYVVRGQKNLPYKIANVYDNNKINNTITLITKYKKVEMQNITNIKFVKDGQSGTNGTNYKADVLINGHGYEDVLNIKNHIRPFKVKFIYDKNKKWYYYDAIEDSIFSYNDNAFKIGARVLSQNEVQYSYTAMVFDSKVTNPIISIENGYLRLKKDKNGELPEWISDSVNVVELEVKVTNTGATRNWNVFCYFPIEIIRVDEDLSKEVFKYMLPDVRGGFTEAIYDTEGMNPKYTNTVDFYVNQNIVNDKGEEEPNIIPVKWSSKENGNIIITPNEKDNLHCKISPRNYFSNGDSQNYIKMESEEKGFEYIKPILLLLNRYGLKSVNGWDGNKIYMDDENGEFILAPQIGAGRKERDNSFTGILMGVRERADKEEDVGLYGYNSGVQTIFMDAEDGSLVLGSVGKWEDGKLNGGGGRIIIDPSRSDSIIFSESYFSNDSYDSAGQLKKDCEYDYYKKLDKPKDDRPKCNYEYVPTKCINPDGKGLQINFTQPFIRYGSGHFAIDPEGCMEATNAYISGIIEAESGKVGPWTIHEGAIESDWHYPGKDDYEYKALMQHDGTILNRFRKHSDGTEDLPQLALQYDGTLATYGFDGGSTSNTGNPIITLNKRGLFIYDGERKVTHPTGEGQEDEWIPGYEDGPISIARFDSNGVTIGGNSFTTTGVNITSGSIQMGDVTIAGSGSTIGGWSISKDGIKNGGTELTSSGLLKSSDCEFTKGSIGGWLITENSLKSPAAGTHRDSQLVLNDNGSIAIAGDGQKFIDGSNPIYLYEVDLDGTGITLSGESTYGDEKTDKVTWTQLLSSHYSLGTPFISTNDNDIYATDETEGNIKIGSLIFWVHEDGTLKLQNKEESAKWPASQLTFTKVK